MLGQWEPGELRGSRRVLRAAEGEVPSADSPVVFIPKYRKKVIFGQIRKELGDVMKRLAEQKESWIETCWTAHVSLAATELLRLR